MKNRGVYVRKGEGRGGVDADIRTEERKEQGRGGTEPSTRKKNTTSAIWAPELPSVSDTGNATDRGTH